MRKLNKLWLLPQFKSLAWPNWWKGSVLPNIGEPSLRCAPATMVSLNSRTWNIWSMKEHACLSSSQNSRYGSICDKVSPPEAFCMQNHSLYTWRHSFWRDFLCTKFRFLASPTRHIRFLSKFTCMLLQKLSFYWQTLLWMSSHLNVEQLDSKWKNILTLKRWVEESGVLSTLSQFLLCCAIIPYINTLHT